VARGITSPTCSRARATLNDPASCDWAVPQKAATRLDRYGRALYEIAADVAFVAVPESSFTYRRDLTRDGGMNRLNLPTRDVNRARRVQERRFKADVWPQVARGKALGGGFMKTSKLRQLVFTTRSQKPPFQQIGPMD